MPDNPNESINLLWDELTDFGAEKAVLACDHLMAILADWLQAKNVGWVGSVRTGFDDNDPLQGWRICTLRYQSWPHLFGQDFRFAKWSPAMEGYPGDRRPPV